MKEEGENSAIQGLTDASWRKYRLHDEQRDCLEVRLSFWKRTVFTPARHGSRNPGQVLHLKSVSCKPHLSQHLGTIVPPVRAAGHSHVGCSLNKTLGRGDNGD